MDEQCVAMKEPKDCLGKFGSGPETEIAIQRKSYRRTLCIGLIVTTKESFRTEMVSKIFFPSGIVFRCNNNTNSVRNITKCHIPSA